MATDYSKLAKMWRQEEAKSTSAKDRRIARTKAEEFEWLVRELNKKG